MMKIWEELLLSPADMSGGIDTAENNETAPPPETPEDDGAEAAALDEVFAKHEEGQPRDDQGRYASKEQQDEDTEDDPEEADDEDQVVDVERPSSWTSQMDEAWSKLSAEEQHFIAERDKQFFDKFSEQGRALQQYAPLNEAIMKHAPVIQQMQAHPAEVFDSLMQNWVSLHQDPVNTLSGLAEAVGADIDQIALGQDPIGSLHRMAASAGIDLLDIALGDGQQPMQQQYQHQQYSQQPDPRLEQAAARIQQLEQERAYMMAQIPQPPDPNEQQALAVMENFAEQNADFEELSPMIATILPEVRQASPHLDASDHLQIAYDRAAQWVDNQAGKRMSQVQGRHQAAERAKSANIRGNGATGEPAQLSEEQELDAIFKKHGF